MTFTEAAIEVLRREGKPLHFKKIAEVAIRENLLDHVGKIPEDVMGGQLATHCRLPRSERNVIAVQPGTFALAEWGLEEDPNALEGIAEVPPEEPGAYRPKERHPIPLRDLARGAGREPGRGRRREEGEERRGRRFPPPAEVAYEILAGVERPLALTEVAALGAERFLMPDAFVRDAGSLGAALREDNRRREAAGRQALFAIEGETVSLAVGPEPGERPQVAVVARTPPGAAEMRRSALSALRRRIRECDAPTVEHLAGRLLALMGLREVKVARRGREQVVFTGRKRMGLADVRHCARVVRTSADVGRREVAEVRRDLGHFGAQIGILVSAGDAGRDARAEAASAGQLPVLLLCGEALAEAFAETSLGCRPVLVPEIDDAVFKAAADSSEREEAARIARREERERRERAAGEQAVGIPPVREVSISSAEAAPPGEAAPSAAEPDEAEGDEEGEGEEVGQALQGGGGAPREGGGEGRRRRRRRRRRGGRGRGERRPGAPGEPGAGPAAEAGASPAGEPGAEPTPAPPAPQVESPPAAREPAGGEPAA